MGIDVRKLSFRCCVVPHATGVMLLVGSRAVLGGAAGGDGYSTDPSPDNIAPAPPTSLILTTVLSRQNSRWVES